MLLNKERAIDLMEHYKIDALIATSSENITYSSNFPLLHGCMSDTGMYVVLPREQKISPVMIVSKNAVDLFLACDSWIEDVELWGRFFIFRSEELDVQSLSALEKKYDRIIKEVEPEASDLDALHKVLQERGLLDGRLGIDEKNLTPVHFETIKSRFPNAKIVPGNHIFRKIRMVKSENEIQRLKKATRVNELALQALLDALQEGKTEIELGEIYEEALRREGGKPVHRCIQGGMRGGLVNGEPSDYAFKTGDGVRLDFDCTYSGYYSDIARTAVLGTPGEKLKTYYNAVLKGILRAEEAIKPGEPVSEVFSAAIEVVRKSGIPHFDRHHIGHGLGLECYDLPLVSSTNQTRLEVGTVLNLETPYYEIGFGCAHVEDTVIVTHTGCERLQTTGLELKML
jgi:Xaa-Pro aminopeptidase